MKLIMNFLFLTLIAMTGCSQDEQPTIADELKIVWSKESGQSYLAENFSPVFYEDKVIYGWNIALIEDSILKPPIVAYDKNTGDKIWEWSSYLEDAQSWTSWQAKYTYDNILVFSTTKGNIYAINMDTGETLWSTDFEGSENYVHGYSERLYYITNTPDHKIYYIQKGNIYTGEWEVIYTINTEEGFDRSRIGVPHEYKNGTGETMLFFSWSKSTFDPLATTSYLSIYNLSTGTLEYNEEVQNTNAHGRGLLIVDQKAFLGGPINSCFDLQTHEIVWSNPHHGGLGFSGFLYEGNTLYYMTGGTFPSLYAVNPDTGQEIWKAPASGTSSWMAHHNDIIYFNGGGDGLLHAVDAITGEVLLEAQSPDYGSNSNAFFSSGISIDPETGRIYTGNYINALCFEPLR